MQGQVLPYRKVQSSKAYDVGTCASSCNTCALDFRQGAQVNKVTQVSIVTRALTVVLRSSITGQISKTRVPFICGPSILVLQTMRGNVISPHVSRVDISVPPLQLAVGLKTSPQSAALPVGTL